MFNNLLFDFDGTVVESGQAIFSGLKKTYKDINLPCPSDEKLQLFVGPPVEEGFRLISGIEDEEIINRASAIYRNYFDTETYKESFIYPQVIKLIEKLNKQNEDIDDKLFQCFIASSRLERSLFPMIEYLNINHYFDGVYGSNLDKNIVTKALVIKHLFENENITTKENTLMIGDRMYDILGAHEMGIKVAAITWGYGSIDEFEKYKADYIIHNTEELFDLITDNN